MTVILLAAYSHPAGYLSWGRGLSIRYRPRRGCSVLAAEPPTIFRPVRTDANAKSGERNQNQLRQPDRTISRSVFRFREAYRAVNRFNAKGESVGRLTPDSVVQAV